MTTAGTGFKPRNPEYAAFLARYAAAQGYLAMLGVQFAGCAPGQAEYRLRYRPDIGQQNGFFHGGVVGGLAEAVMGAAAATLVAVGVNVVGAEYKVNFLSPAQGEVLIARGQVLKPGRTLIVCRADVFVADDKGEERLVSIAQGSMAPVGERG